MANFREGLHDKIKINLKKTNKLLKENGLSAFILVLFPLPKWSSFPPHLQAITLFIFSKGTPFSYYIKSTQFFFQRLFSRNGLPPGGVGGSITVNQPAISICSKMQPNSDIGNHRKSINTALNCKSTPKIDKPPLHCIDTCSVYN